MFLKVEKNNMIRSGFKTFNRVQSQGGASWLTAGIHIVFWGLDSSPQRRIWARGEVLKSLLNINESRLGIIKHRDHIEYG